jgi:hypothetical protein
LATILPSTQLAKLVGFVRPVASHLNSKSSKKESIKLFAEADFLEIIGTKVFRVFLLAIHSDLY